MKDGGSAAIASPAGKPEASGHLAQAVLVIVLLPFLLVAANSRWIFTSLKFIDAWVSFGYFQHLRAYESTLFPDLYYGSRLPWLLPGHLAYRLFEPITANYVLHFTFYYLATFSIFSLLRRVVGFRNALLGTVLLGTYGPFLFAIGRDYVDGAGLTYFLLALATAARATQTRPQAWLLVSGMAGLAMCYTNLFLVFFLPFVPGLYVFMMFAGVNRKSLAVLKDVLVWFGAGAVIVSVALGAISYAVDRNFWFYMPSIHAVIVLTSRPNPFVAHGWAWLRTTTWLGIPVAATVASVAYLFRGTLKPRDFRTFFMLQFLAIVCGMAAWQIIGSTGLYWYFYASYLIPSMFLAIGCLLAQEKQERPTYAWWMVMAGSIGALTLSVYLADGTLANMLRSKSSLAIAAALAAAGLMCNVVFSRKWYVVVAAVAGLAIYQLGYTRLERPSARYEMDWRHVVEGAKAVWPYEQQQRPVWFWYDVNAPHGDELYSINAVYLWGYTYVGTHFPEIEAPSRLTPGATIVMVADSPGWVERANQALRVTNLHGTPVGTYTVGHDAGAFQIGFLQLEADPAH